MDYQTLFNHIQKVSEKMFSWSELDPNVRPFIRGMTQDDVDSVLLESIEYTKAMDSYPALCFYYKLGLELVHIETLRKKKGDTKGPLQFPVFQCAQSFSDIFRFKIQDQFTDEMALAKQFIIRTIRREYLENVAEFEKLQEPIRTKEHQIMSKKGYVREQEGWVKYI